MMGVSFRGSPWRGLFLNSSPIDHTSATPIDPSKSIALSQSTKHIRLDLCSTSRSITKLYFYRCSLEVISCLKVGSVGASCFSCACLLFVMSLDIYGCVSAAIDIDNTFI
jgi:hypothetical protein